VSHQFNSGRVWERRCKALHLQSPGGGVLEIQGLGRVQKRRKGNKQKVDASLGLARIAITSGRESRQFWGRAGRGMGTLFETGQASRIVGANLGHRAGYDQGEIG